MRILRSGRAVAAIIITIVCVAGAVAAFRGPLAAAVIPRILGAATGTNVEFSRIDLHASYAEFIGVKVTSHRGQPIAYIPRVDMTYGLRDLLPGSRHRYGLHSIAVYDPQISIIHNRDGTYNIPSQAKRAASPRAASPLNFSARILNGRLSVTDYTRIDRQSQHLYVDGLNLNANVNTAGLSHYAASLAYREGSRRYPVYGDGTIDVPRGYNLQHWTAAKVPLPRIVDYGVNNASLRMIGGALENVDAWYYGKLTATAHVRGVKVTMAELRAPIRNGQGILDVGSDAATTNGFTADLNGIPVTVTGGISDLSNPQLRFSITARGDASQFAKAATQTARMQVHGAIELAMLAEGTPKSPDVLIAMQSPHIDYHGTPIDRPHALVAFDGREADVLGAALGYRALALSAQGRASLSSQPNGVEMFASVGGPSAAVPFAPSLIPSMELRGSVLALGKSLKQIDTLGVLTGAGSGEQLAGSFHIDNAGSGTAGPIFIMGPHRSMYARIAIDHPHAQLAALVRAQNFGVALRGASATLTGNIYAEEHGNALGMLGAAGLTNARYGALAIEDADARFGGNVGDVRVSELNARGTFGTLHAAGTISATNHVALTGRYSGSLAALSHIAGNLPAKGFVSAPIALLYDGGHAFAQIHDARFTGANVRGIPVTAMSATIGTAGRNVRVYAARAQMAGSASATVAGSLGRGMALSVADLDAGALRGAGLPLQSGIADAAATMRGPLTDPDVDGALLLQNGRFNQYPVSAQATIAYAGDTLDLRDGLASLGPALVTVDGSVSGIRMGAPIVPAYDLRATMRAADAGALVAMAQPKLSSQHIAGSIDASVRVTGSGKMPSVSGNIRVPEGSVHGLAFRNMRATLNGTMQNFNIAGGGVTIGSTPVAFSAGIGSGVMRAAIRAPNANLADFNDYFDTADTLAGTGSVAMTIAAAGSSLNTGGNVALRGFRFRRFDVGNANARWSTAGRVVSLAANVGGSSGLARVSGTVSVAPYSTLPQLVTGADTNLTATLRGLDLATWMPMLGYSAPVTGTLDADAMVRGRFPNETIAARANLNDATVGRIAVQRAQAAVTATRGRGRVTQAIVQIPYLTANGSGTFGLHANDPIDLAMRATSPDVGELMKTVTGKPQKLAGALDTTLRVQGTRTDPALSDDFALTSIRYAAFTVPRVSATIAATKTRVAIRNGLVQFTRGSIAASGSVPVTMTPHLELDPRNEPVQFALAANNVDLSAFESALPKGTRLAGTIGGRLTVGGTLNDPQLNGSIAMQNGYFVGPIDQNPISKVNGTLAFAGTTVALQALQANVGGGTMAMNATAHLPNVRDFRAATFSARITAKGAQFNSPQYFRGKVNADVTAERPATGLPQLAGSVDIPSARIPLSAFWNPRAPAGPTKTLPDVAMNLHATVGNDVRVQSSNVDVGAQGSAIVGGTLPSPTLRGHFTSTGGTVSFFRTFSIEDAAVRFDPSNGIMPFVNATATTDVNQTYIALNVSGLAPDNMHLDFTSDPSYSEQQIMGILAGVGGPAGPALAGAGDFSANSAVESMAAGEVNTFFTREMLEPLSASLGNALGLQNLQLTDDFASGFGLNAAKAFGKHVTVMYNESLGQPQRESLSLEAHRGESTAFDLMFYQVSSPQLLAFDQSESLMGFDNGVGAAINVPNLGQNGTSLLYEHKF